MNNIKKDPTLAGVLSFILPGLGQVYCGRVGRGVGIWIAGMIGLGCFVIPGIIIWIFSIYDACDLARKYNE